MKTGLNRWKYKPLGELTEKIGSGATPKGGKGAYKESGISLIRSMNVHDLNFRYKDLAKIDEEQAAELSNVEVEARDVLLNITGASIARCVQVPLDVLPARVNQHVSILRPKEGLLDSRFLSYLLVWNNTKSRLLNIGEKAGATRQALTKAQIQDFEIILPSLDEQKRIVEILDQTFSAIDRARALVEANLTDVGSLFDAAKQSILDEVSTDGSKVSLAQVAAIESSLVDPREPQYIDLPHIGAGNISPGSGELSNVMTAREENLISGKYLFDSRDVLYSKIRPYLRKVARPDFEGMCSADMYPLRPSHALDRGFLFYTLLSARFTEYAESGSARAGMPKVNREHLFKYEFQLPNIEEQRKAVAKIDAALGRSSELRRMFQQKLTDLANLHQSLLQKAFSGQLT